MRRTGRRSAKQPWAVRLARARQLGCVAIGLLLLGCGGGPGASAQPLATAASSATTSTPSAVVTASPPPSATVVPVASIGPAASPFSIAIEHGGSNTEPFESQRFHLAPGAYDVKWAATTAGDCGITMNVFRDPDDGFSTVVASTLVGSSTGGATTMTIIEEGDYYLWSYTGCPWTVEIANAGSTDYVSGADLRAQWLAWDDAVGEAFAALLDPSDSLKVANAATAMGHASKEAAAWIDAMAPRVRPEQIEAVRQWRDAVSAVDRVGEAIFVAAATGSVSDVSEAVSQINDMNKLRRLVAELFAPIQ